jgi:hypothetical protein
MDEKYYKKYLKYKNKYALLKNAFSNEMYAQYGGNPNEYVEMVGINSPPPPLQPRLNPPPALPPKQSPPALPPRQNPPPALPPKQSQR